MVVGTPNHDGIPSIVFTNKNVTHSFALDSGDVVCEHRTLIESPPCFVDKVVNNLLKVKNVALEGFYDSKLSAKPH